MKQLSDFDALIFDIDGTLWNASPATAKGWNLALEKLELGQIITPAQIETVSGLPYEECVDILLPGLKSKVPELLATLDCYEIRILRTEGGNLYQGVQDGIRQLAATYKIFLVSNCQEWYLGLFLDFSNFKPVLAGFDCHGLSGLPKNEMLSRLKAHHCLLHPVYIGDTAGDEKAANLAGIDFIHAAWGFGQPEGKPKAVYSFNELLGYLSQRE